MIVSLSENEIKSLIKRNKKEQFRNPVSKHRPLTDPYSFWVDENGNRKDYHCAFCGYKTHTKLDKCPYCKSDILDVEHTEIQRYTNEV